LLQPRGQSAEAPRGNAKGHAEGRGKAAHAHQGANGEKGDPPGNNGTVKIAPVGEKDGTPDNNPHVGCTFQIEWYGFDEGADIWSTVEFAMHSPTTHVDLSGTSPEKVFVGGDPATGAGTETGPDGSQVYTLSFDGEPHAQQGYHVKLTVHTPYSQGSDEKHKVYWVEPCDEGSEVPEAAPGAAGGEQGPPEESGTQAADQNGTEVPVEQADDETAVLGAQASAQDNAGTQAAGRPAGSSAAVPASVEAGMNGSDRLRSMLPALAILFGLAVTGAALVHRRRSRGSLRHS
jgi:hypothetical protein